MTPSRHQAFSELLERHRKIVFKVANTYAWHPEDRADLVQEIAAQLWRAFPRYDAEREFSTWMYRIALNVAISFVRSHSLRQKHHVPLDESQHDCITEDTNRDEADEQVRLLNRFIDQQDPLNRALLLLYLEERSTRDIAEVLGISESNVTTKISRLKQKLRQDLTNDLEPALRIDHGTR